MPSRMATVVSTLAEIEELTAGCLGCGKPVPEDSLSDIFCTKVDHQPGCSKPRNDMGCVCEPDLDSCQIEALNRQVDDPSVGEDNGWELSGYDTDARWRPELVDDSGTTQEDIQWHPCAPAAPTVFDVPRWSDELGELARHLAANVHRTQDWVVMTTVVPGGTDSLYLRRFDRSGPRIIRAIIDEGTPDERVIIDERHDFFVQEEGST